jgi:hypothetical protein
MVRRLTLGPATAVIFREPDGVTAERGSRACAADRSEPAAVPRELVDRYRKAVRVCIRVLFAALLGTIARSLEGFTIAFGNGDILLAALLLTSVSLWHEARRLTETDSRTTARPRSSDPINCSAPDECTTEHW